MAYLIRPAKRLKISKSGNSKLILEQIESFISENQDEPIRILCGFWGDQQDAISYQELRAGILAGRLDANIYEQWAQDYSLMVTNKFAPVWNNALIAGSGSQPIMSTVLERSSSFRFDTSLPGSANWITTHGADFVTRCSQQQKEAIQSLLSMKVIESHTVDELAQFIRPCIGLTEAQSKAALKYYDTIKATLREQHPRMKAETIQTKAVKAASRYAERAHRYRAMTIAQTELASAYNKGADEGIRQAMNEGLLGTMAKVWSTSGDENVCEICAALEGVQVGMDDSFDYNGKPINSAMDAKLLPPAHPRCACAIEYVEVDKPMLQPKESLQQETDEPTTSNFDLDEKESELENSKSQLQELRNEEQQRQNEALAQSDYESMRQIHAEYAERTAQLESRIKELETEISDYKMRLGGHLTAEDFWGSLPENFLNQRMSYDTTMKDEIVHELANWTGEGYKEAKASQVLERTIELSSEKFSGDSLYRGITLPDDVFDKLQVGSEVMQDGLSSWSTSKDIAMQFAYTSDNPVLLVDTTKGERDALSIKAFSHIQYENEVLYSGKARLQVVGRRQEAVEYSFQGEIRTKEVTVVEVKEIR